MENQNPPLPTIPPERGDDLHNLEYLSSVDLILFMAGNQFMAMGDVLHNFQKQNPSIEKIFYETLPPGLELKQILSGGARFRDQVIDVRPDVYASVSMAAMERLASAGFIGKDAPCLYLHNRLVLMVPSGNPLGITSVTDLAKPEIRISQPDPENEDIAHHILDMYRQAGGEELVRVIMEEKRAVGRTLLTTVHHRQTPDRILQGEVDVGPVWATEVVHAVRSGLPLEAVEVGKAFDQRERINYYVTPLKDSPHPETRQYFIDFLLSPPAQKIYQGYGFVPHLSV